MQIACASICYRGYTDDEVSATLDLGPQAGYRFMEIHGPLTWSTAAIDAFDVVAVKRRLGESALRCIGLYPPGWGGTDAADVRRHAHAIARAAHYADELGCQHIDTTGATGRGDGAIERVIDCVRQVLELAPPTSQIKLTLENHYGNVLEQPEDFQRVFDAIDDPRVGLCLDVGHFHAAQVMTQEVIRHFAERLYAVHLKDHVGAQSVGIGRGEIDLPTMIATLREIGYRGDLTVELEVADPENLPRYTREAYIYVCGLLGSKL